MANLTRLKIGSHYGEGRPWWLIQNQLRRIDSFGKELPTFNLKGNTHVNTIYGGIVTLTMYILTLLFAIAKAVILINGYNPHISETTELDSFQIFDKINLNEINYRMAFVIEDYDTYTTKNDP